MQCGVVAAADMHQLFLNGIHHAMTWVLWPADLWRQARLGLQALGWIITWLSKQLPLRLLLSSQFQQLGQQVLLRCPTQQMPLHLLHQLPRCKCSLQLHHMPLVSLFPYQLPLSGP